MFSKKLMTAALAIAAAGAFAGSAQASVIDYDDVKLTSVGYDFGGSGYAFGEPTGSGEIHFHHENGGIRPHLLSNCLLDADRIAQPRRLLPLRPTQHPLHRCPQVVVPQPVGRRRRSTGTPARAPPGTPAGWRGGRPDGRRRRWPCSAC